MDDCSACQGLPGFDGKPVPKTIDELMTCCGPEKAAPGDNNYAQLRTVFNQLYLWRDFDSSPSGLTSTASSTSHKDNEVKAYVETPSSRRPARS
jgi:hypothetical protein